VSDITIRRAEQADLPALLHIYNYYVLNTAITFDIEPRTLEQRQMWFKRGLDSGSLESCNTFTAAQ